MNSIQDSSSLRNQLFAVSPQNSGGGTGHKHRERHSKHNLQPLTQAELESIPGWSPGLPASAPLPPPDAPSSSDAAVVAMMGSLTGVVFACVRTEDENGQPYFNLLE